jgi:pyruvate,water dikinase
MEKEVQYNVDFVKWFSELSNKDIAIAGGKGASLAEMYNSKFPIPPGFMITAQAYSYFIEKTNLNKEIIRLIKDLDIEDTKNLNKISGEIRALIETAEIPKEMSEVIIEAYDVLDVDKKSMIEAKGTALAILKHSHEPPFVAVRSSATTEDLADASFAGQQESFLNVKGHKDLIVAIKKCFSSLFTPRAIYYRKKKNFDSSSQLAIVIQKMINSDKSGVMFSNNPIKNDNSILIEAVYGLGEGIVSGRIKPDSYVIDSDLEKFKIITEEVNEKKVAIVRDSSGNNKIIKLTEERSKTRVLENYEIKILAQYAKRLEEHYKKPQDIEFAIADKEIYIVQSRPITTSFKQNKDAQISGKVLLSGLGASPGVASGTVRIIHDLDELDKVQSKDVLVTEMTNPDMVVAMQRASAIVTDEGGITSHAAIVSREMGIPAVVGTGEATKKLKDGQLITVDGYTGRVIDGKGETQVVEIKPIVETKTKIKVIVDLPDYAERAALCKTKSVGLVRLEGIIAESGKHPLLFVKEKKLAEYTNVIFRGIKRIAEHFEEVWIRSSDIRSDEYKHLEGSPGKVELNPMLGNHGIRFSLKHPEILHSELHAIKELAEIYPEKKIGFMIPQVISVQEVEDTKKIAESLQMPDNVKLGIMVETPAAVQIINQLCETGIKFVSFGTNDLTQYILAIDRNNEEIQDIYNEENPAVLSAIGYVIRRCKKYGVETSICGQAASRESMVRFLISEEIDSLSVNADAAYSISVLVAGLEKNPIAKMIESAAETISEFVNPEKKQDKLAGQALSKIEQIHEKQPPQTLTAEQKPNKHEIKQVKENILNSQDIETIILKQLDGKEDFEDGIEKENEYFPGIMERLEPIPSLNDSSPLTSEVSKIIEQEAVQETSEQLTEQPKEEGSEEVKEEIFEEEIDLGDLGKQLSLD